MNAWSAVNIDHKSDTTTYADGDLSVAWTAEVWPRAAEIIRYTYTPAAGQPTFNVPQFGNMLRNVYLPHVINGWTGGGANWLPSMDEATMNIGIFLDDHTIFDKAVATWRAEVPAEIYMSGDTNKWSQLAGLPISPPGTVYDTSTTTATNFKNYWHNPNSYITGLEGETCRDINHMAMGFGGIINAAETTRLQGVDLYG